MNILKFIFITCIVIYTIPCSAQVVKSKDGVSLGDRKEFISGCTQGTDNGLMNFNGLEIETYKYCACICDNLIPTLYSWEIKEAVVENKMIDLFLKDENIDIIMKCLEGNFNIQEDYKFSTSENPELEKKFGIRSCVKEIMNDDENKDIWTKELAEEYCDCAINKLYDAGYTYKDILEIEDENSESFHEIILPCVAEVLTGKPEIKSSNSYKSDDIKGDVDRSLVPLIDYLGQGYKIKISISGVTKYFLFDTGVSDLIIDRDTERKLLLNGALKRENYRGVTEYVLANNQTIQAQEAVVDNIIIGDYTLNNVVIAIIDDGLLLCGKSFLDKFNKWEIDIKNNFLILYK
jgi:hypothetical protein